MGVSLIDIQRDAVLRAIKDAARGEWKILIVDQSSWKLIQNVVTEDDILAQHIANIEQIEQKRAANRDMDAIYLLTPEPHIVDCVMADFERRRYRKASLLWTSLLPASLRERVDRSRLAQEQLLQLRVLDVGFYARESHLVTFRDPWSFPILYHPACNNLVRQHLSDLSQKIVSVCVSLGEYPTIRFYRPRSAAHEASVLCSHLAKFVQDEIDMYATYHRDFPPPSPRPRGTLYILDRSMDLIAPVVHEFTYQAMVHDLLPVKDGEKVTYRMQVGGSDRRGEEKDVEISDKDNLWVHNRHRHMKDTIEKLMGEFQKFMHDNPHFTDSNSDNATSLSAIKDMMAGLPQFQEMKEAYSLHLTMAQEAMNQFQSRKLPDLASVEQSLATGLDEDHKKPKGMADQVIRSLDAEDVGQPDRLRLLILYLLFRDGLLPGDTEKLLAHAQLPPMDGDALRNLHLLGARISRTLKDHKSQFQPLFPPKPPTADPQEEYSLSRFTPALKSLLQEHSKNSLDQNVFPFTKPQMENDDQSGNVGHTSLRSAKPTWAKTRASANEPRQRVLVFMAGGSTYSESRSCYEISEETNKDVYLITSHMMNPSLFIRQVGDLSVDKRRLAIPMEQPKPKAPAHLFEADPPPPAPSKPAPPQQQQQGQAPPTSQMANMKLDGQAAPPNGQPMRGPTHQQPPPPQSQPSVSQYKEGEKKKKHGLFHRSKK